MHYLPKDNIDFPFNQNESVCHLSECKCYFGLFIQFSLLFFLEPVTLTRMIRECLRKQNTDRQKKNNFTSDTLIRYSFVVSVLHNADI